MKSISVGELRQNPTQMLQDVAAGETYDVTRHNRVVARIVPSMPSSDIVPAKKQGGANTRSLPPIELPVGMTVDDVLAEMKGQW